MIIIVVTTARELLLVVLVAWSVGTIFPHVYGINVILSKC